MVGPQKEEPDASSVRSPSFVIAEIMKGRLTGDKLSWRRTKSKLVAYVSNLLVRLYLLGEGMKEMLNIAGPYLTN